MPGPSSPRKVLDIATLLIIFISTVLQPRRGPVPLLTTKPRKVLVCASLSSGDNEEEEEARKPVVLGDVVEADKKKTNRPLPAAEDKVVLVGKKNMKRPLPIVDEVVEVPKKVKKPLQPAESESSKKSLAPAEDKVIKKTTKPPQVVGIRNVGKKTTTKRIIPEDSSDDELEVGRKRSKRLISDDSSVDVRRKRALPVAASSSKVLDKANLRIPGMVFPSEAVVEIKIPPIRRVSI